ncbi:MAG TPA: hypothetical protein VEH09_06660 [Thermodesulfobacteriota bacterium]|nr:hypothetical protein [Thermodesulfobacteriota bacterium]
MECLRHGLLGKEVVIRTGERRENPAEFKTLLMQLGKSLEPEGSSKRCWPRGSRSPTGDGGELSGARWGKSLRPKLTLPTRRGAWGLRIGSLLTLEERRTIDSNGVRERINVLEALSQNLRKNETFSDEAKSQLKEKFGAKDGFVRYISICNDGLVKSKKEAGKTSKCERFERLRDDLLESIHHQKQILERVESELKRK